jgi:hypothetical protein
LQVWTDEGIDYGAQWPGAIEKNIEDCAVFVPVLSSHSRASSWVTREILLAQNLDKPIFPLLLEGRRFLELLDIQDEVVRDGRMPDERWIMQIGRLIGTARGAAPLEPTKPSPTQTPVSPTLSSPSALVSGRVVAWGDNSSGQVEVPAGLPDAIAVAAGDRHSLALHDDGHVTAWGSNEYGQVSVPAGLAGAVAVAAGYNNSLALHRNGHVTAWGDLDRPRIPARLSEVVAIAAHGVHSLALHRDGHVTAWAIYALA